MKQYFHSFNKNTKGGKTYCVEVPSTSDFLKMVADNIYEKKPIVLNVGVAKCNKDDFYNKKIGREISSSRLSETKLKLKWYYTTDCNTHIHLYAENTVFHFKINDKSENVWLLEVLDK